MQSEEREGAPSPMWWIVCGLLPVLGIAAELKTGMFANFLWPLFPTPWFAGAAIAAVALNLLLFAWPEQRWLPARAAATGFVTGTTATFAVAQLPALPAMVFACVVGLGFLAMAPYWAGLGLTQLWPRLVAAWRAAGRQMPSLIACSVPPMLLLPGWTAASHWRQDTTERAMWAAATALDPAAATAAAATLRGMPLAPQYWLCDPIRPGGLGWARPEQGIPMPTPFSGWPVSRESRLTTQQARSAFYLAHGRLPPIAQPVQLVDSELDVAIEPAAAIARIDWQLAFTGTGRREPEADVLLHMPRGAVASALSLWIAGTERPAAFAASQKVQAAYEAVVARRRDPALLQEVAPDCLRLRLFPVPVHGAPMRVRVGLTVPLHLRDDGAWLSLPDLQPRGCEVLTSGHRVTLRENGTLREQRMAPVGTLANAPLRLPLPAPTSHTTDGEGLLCQHLSAADARPDSAAAHWVLALDGSSSMDAALPDPGAVLDALPATAPCTLFVATAREFTRRDGTCGDADLRRWLSSIDGVGGVDAAPMLAAATLATAAIPGARLVWLSGDQPIATDSAAAVRDQLARDRVPLTVLPLGHAGNVVLADLGQACAVLPRTADPIADLRWALARGEALEAATRTFSRPTADADVTTLGVEVSDQLARLHAATMARALWRDGAHAAAAALAARFRVATAGVGAVVLESKEQYEAAGLDPGAAIGTEPATPGIGSPVPEPSTLVLLATGLALAAFLRRRARA